MQNSKNLAIVSIVCGIASIVLPWIPVASLIFSIIALAAGIVAIVLGAKVRKLNDQNKGIATGGLVTGIIGVVLSGIIFACALCTVCAVATTAGILAS